MPLLTPVLLCGGSGARLWPLSREQYPKQFIAFDGPNSLFQKTLLRLQGLDCAPAMLICHEDHRFLVLEQLRLIQVSSGDLLLEPESRNTAPALTLAALRQQAQNPVQDLLLVLPSDHVIQNTEAFYAAVAQAVTLAEGGRIVTFGIVPDRPETGYGYIQAEGHQITAFIEKPPLEQAEAFLRSGNMLWNSGMFLCRASVWLAEVERLQPGMLQACRAALAEGMQDQLFFRPAREAFSQTPALSIDYALMEQTELGSVVPLDAGWSDLGSWCAVHSLRQPDARGNTCQGAVVAVNSHNNTLESTGRLLAVVGVDDLIVVETADAVLVTRHSCDQAVRELVNTLRSQQRPEVEHHRKVSRPWGAYETVDQGPQFQVKRITVQPGQALSLQMHHHRSEHWVVVRGTARVTRDEEVLILSENQSIDIPLGTVHRLENPGSIPLELIEIQSGSYLGEDDIVRYADRYQRHTGG
ncbi:MAG: mannose-1-phosphate guanylyltransferase/mannose-6-phosphate isomerase [Candidatus Sericytochromatia bacterium]|nr:mannose-1-phosphate guanylyltransferase/mannose-6-phosphate isomerase [Candidatus Sericytochromatia bacterium]